VVEQEDTAEDTLVFLTEDPRGELLFMVLVTVEETDSRDDDLLILGCCCWSCCVRKEMKEGRES